MANQFMILRQETLQILYELRDNSLSSLREHVNNPNMTVERLNEIMTHVADLREAINDPMGIWDQTQPPPPQAAVEVPGDNSPAVTISTEEDDEEEEE